MVLPAYSTIRTHKYFLEDFGVEKNMVLPAYSTTVLPEKWEGDVKEVKNA